MSIKSIVSHFLQSKGINFAVQDQTLLFQHVDGNLKSTIVMNCDDSQSLFRATAVLPKLPVATVKHVDFRKRALIMLNHLNLNIALGSCVLLPSNEIAYKISTFFYNMQTCESVLRPTLNTMLSNFGRIIELLPFMENFNVKGSPLHAECERVEGVINKNVLRLCGRPYRGIENRMHMPKDSRIYRPCDLTQTVRKLQVIPPSHVKIVKKIGQGGFADILLAEYLGTPVVVKQIKPNLTRDVKPMFFSEIDVMAQLAHPNIVQLLGYIEEPFAFVMEYMTRGSVRDVLKKEKNKVSQKKRLTLLRDAARGLNYLHFNRVIHGDVKPLNLLVDDELHCKLGDFGLAVIKEANADMEQGGVRIFTPSFAAPEMFHKYVSPASDVFAFASTIFYIIKGESPFDSESKDELKRMINDGPRPKVKGVMPETLANLVTRAWIKEPEMRPTMQEFTDCLNALCSKEKK